MLTVFPIRKDCSKLDPTIPPPRKLPMERIRTVTMEPLMPGSVICQIRFSLPAPSMLAASYSVLSIPAMAARKMIAHQPELFQMDNTTAIPQK